MIAEIINRYSFIVSHLGNLIEVSGYRNDYIAKKLGVQPSYFSLKKNKGNWSLDEVSKVLNVIQNEDVQNYYDTLIIEENLKEGGELVNSEEFEKRMGWI